MTIATDYVQSVSIPRSGYHYLARQMSRIFDDFVTCNFYGHCEGRECDLPKICLRKNHDFDLKLPVVDGRKHIVLYRHPIMCWSSGVFLILLQNAMKLGKPQSKGLTGQLDHHFYDYSEEELKLVRDCINDPKDKLSFEQFFHYVRSFIARWVTPKNNELTMKIPYDRIEKNQEEELLKMALFFALNADRNALAVRVRSAVESEPFKTRDSVKEILNMNIVSRERLHRAMIEISSDLKHMPGIRPIEI